MPAEPAIARGWGRRCASGAVLIAALSLLMPHPARAREVSDEAMTAVARSIEIRRTTDDIPHIRANGWRDLGIGIGYVQAQDALCTLAESFVTNEGRRSLFFGAEQRPSVDSNVGRPKNIDSDFFFRAFVDDAAVARFQAEQPRELNDLAEGFAQGYNRWLREAQAHPRRHAHRACLGKKWVREISAQDIHRRMYASHLTAGYLQFLPDIVNASPGRVQASDAVGSQELRVRLANNLGPRVELGSNVIAWGRRATAGDGAVLLGNPHWYWGGPDRFYQMHLTIPGKLNVAGVGFLGVPLVMVGFNEHVAWSHTVSSARRFGLFQLELDPSDPRRYLVDGVSESMRSRTVSVEVADEGGRVRQVSRTLYTSRFGPVVDLGRMDPALGWSAQRALAVRDVNADNQRVYRNFLRWNLAGSLDEFIAIQRKEAAMPWVNTVAIGKGDGRVWYADIGAVPDVPDDHRQACNAPLAGAFAKFDPRTPFLDGSRSACIWHVDREAVQSGAMPAERLPSLLREDYVANMNDSYWLANVDQPLDGFPSLLGAAQSALHHRGRLGHQIAIDLLQRGARSSEELGRWAMQEALRSRAYSAEQFKLTLLDQACSRVGVPASAGRDAYTKACGVLRAWGNTGEAGDRGALLWEAFWDELEKTPEGKLYRTSFSIDAPLSTPAVPMPNDGGAGKALTSAIVALSAKGIPLDAATGSQRYVRSGGRRWPIYGGCGGAGYFTVACPEDGKDVLDANAVSNSYLQVVRFGEKGVEAHTLLAHGQDELAVSNGRGSAPVARYSRKAWLRFPFNEADIQRDPQLTRAVLRP